MDRWEAEREIVQKALRDPEFRKKLKRNPKATCLEFFKNKKWVHQLAKYDIKIHEEKAQELILNLPHISQSKEALSDIEIEQLAAGYTCDCSIDNSVITGC